MKIISFCSWKGGTGKTSLATACIELLAERDKAILIIDLDSNLSISNIYNAIGKKYTSIELLNGNTKIENIFDKKYKRTNIIPSDLRIARLNNISDRVLKINLKKTLDKCLFIFDYIFIDPPGTMNALTRNAMVAANKIIVPALFSDIDFQATKLILEEMEMCGIEADIQIVLNRFDAKRNPPEVENQFRNDKDLKPFLWSNKIPAMRSISRLTTELMQGYSLQGRAKQIMENFVNEVII